MSHVDKTETPGTEDVRTKKSFYNADGNANLTNSMENNLETSQKLGMDLPYDQQFLPWRYVQSQVINLC